MPNHTPTRTNPGRSYRAPRTRPTDKEMRELFPPSKPTRTIQAPTPERSRRYAKDLLTRTGTRIRDETRAAKAPLSAAGSAASSALESGNLFGGIGDTTLVVIGSILGLILLDVLVGNRSTSIIGDATGWLTGALGRLISPTDTIIQTPNPAPTTVTAPPGPTGPVGADTAAPATGKSVYVSGDMPTGVQGPQ